MRAPSLTCMGFLKLPSIREGVTPGNQNQFKELRRQLSRNCTLSLVKCFVTIPCWSRCASEVCLRFLGTNGFLVKGKNERFTAEGSRCRQNLLTWESHVAGTSTCGTFFHQKACRTIFLHSTNQIIDLCRCSRHFLNSLLDTLWELKK